MGRVEKLCLQDAQHCCSLWPPRTPVQLLCFKISSTWICAGNPCSVFSTGTLLQKTKNIQNGRPFLLSVPTTVRHEKRNQSWSAGLCLGYPRNNSPQLSSQMLEGPRTGPSVRAHCKFFSMVPLIYGRQMWSRVWKHTPMNQRDSMVCLQGADGHRINAPTWSDLCLLINWQACDVSSHQITRLHWVSPMLLTDLTSFLGCLWVLRAWNAPWDAWTAWPVGHAGTVRVPHLAARHATGLHGTTHNFCTALFFCLTVLSKLPGAMG